MKEHKDLRNKRKKERKEENVTKKLNVSPKKYNNGDHEEEKNLPQSKEVTSFRICFFMFVLTVSHDLFS